MDDPEQFPEPAAAHTLDYLADRAAWIVRIRWPVLATSAAVLAVTAAAGILSSAVPLALTLGAAAAVNAVFLVGRERWSSSDRVRMFIVAQVVLDLGVLTQLLYWGGGADSPFGVLYVFPMAVAGMLLPLRHALALGVLSVGLHGGTLLGERMGLLEHQSLQIGHHAAHDGVAGGALWQSTEFVVAYLVALAVSEFGIVWFVHSLARRLRQSEARKRQHEHVARSRERLARIGTLSAGVAHTVRNPLHGLVNCVDILKPRLSEDPDSHELVELMSDGIERIERLTRRLLVLTREETMEPRPSDPGAILRDSLRLVQLPARAHGVELEADLDDAPVLPLDTDRFSEALVNVLDNAVHASAAGSKVIVRMHCPSDRGMLRIEVEDQGAGIDEADLERVFDPFFTTKPVGEGSGLGLAIARRVVEEHGGSIYIRSRRGRGTRVSIELPYPREEAA